MPTKPLRSGAAMPSISKAEMTLAARSVAASESNSIIPDSPSGDLSCLPLASLLRNLLISEVSRRPLLFNPSLRILSAVAYSEHPLLKPSTNPLWRWLLKPTLYAQFCAGETPAEVAATVARLRAWGINGVLLGWAREVELREGPGTTAQQANALEAVETPSDIAEITAWLDGIRATLALTTAGDVVCIKLTGAGRLNLARLRAAASPSPSLAAGLEELCAAASARHVTFQIDAEQVVMQPGIEAWSFALQRRFNAPSSPVVTVMSTYQAYLKVTPERLARDLARAAREQFTLGVKLVRGAYLASDPRSSICDTKIATDAAYDAIAAALIRRQWSGALQAPAEGHDFPSISLILATHNGNSARRALAVQKEMADAEITTPVVHAQLMGMADHVACELIASRQTMVAEAKANDVTEPPLPRPYKYLVWGSLEECLKYLVRRAEENRDAVQRTEEGRALLWAELRRRVLGA